MAGGKGTRLKAVTGDTPKPLCPLLGKTVIEHIILLLKENGFDDICISPGYRGEDIVSAPGSGENPDVNIKYRREDKPSGTASAVAISVNSQDAEFSNNLALSAKNLVEKSDL